MKPEHDDRVNGLWWLSPTGAIALVVPATFLLAWWFDDQTYRTAWRTAKSLETGTAALFLAGACVFMTAAAIPLFSPRRPVRDPWPGLGEHAYARLARAAGWLFWITSLGYFAFAVSGYRNGVTLGQIVGSVAGQDVDSGTLKDAFGTLPGVTTLTQVGIAFTIIATLVLLHGWRRWLACQFGLVLIMTFGRAFLLTERLALLELLIPALAVCALIWRRAHQSWVRRAVRAGPALFVPAVVALFGLFEYSRSWNFYSARGGSFADFVLQRFAGYYATAYNNGQLALTYERVPGSLPSRTLDAVWSAPLIEQLDLYGRLTGSIRNEDFTRVLELHGNPEFNSSCGLCDPFVDWGPIAGLVLLAALGLILGVAYVGFTNGRLVWLLVYPALVPGLFELPRYLAWTKGRLVPAILALLVVAWWVPRTKRGSPDQPEESEQTLDGRVLA